MRRGIEISKCKRDRLSKPDSDASTSFPVEYVFVNDVVATERDVNTGPKLRFTEQENIIVVG